MGARYYAPNLARFLTRDPSGYAAGPNLYAFCGCDPLDFFDPTGCGPEEGEGWFWHGMRVLGDGTDRFNSAQGPFPLLRLPALFPALRDAHDSMYDFGYAAGNAKASASEVWAKGLKAGYCFGMAGLEIYGAGKMLSEMGEVLEACEGGLCFAAGTPVWVIAGQESERAKSKGSAKSARPYAGVKPVEEVKAGDRVLSRNPQTGKVETKRVLRTTIKQAKVVVSVGLAEGKSGKVVDTLTASREHPFYVRGKGFVPAGGLAIGNAIVTRAGPDVVVKSLTWHRRAEGYKVYNFVVEDDHSYFVGLHNGGAWVHNPPQCDNVTWPATMTPEEALEEGANWCGPDYYEPGGRTGVPSGGVFRSRDGLRQFRMQDSDLLGSHGNIGPHVHFQTFDQFGREIENIHVPISP